MGALSLTALAVSGLELPAWPDRHVLVAPPFIEPVSLSVHRAPFEPTSLRASRAPDGAHHVPGFEPGGSVYDERLNRYAIYASGWTVFGIWPDTEHGPPGCFYGIPVRSLIINRASAGSNPGT